MRWYERYRQNWIHEFLMEFGYINRANIVEMFGTSMGQSSRDLRTFQKFNPGAIVYNKATKRYERTFLRNNVASGG